MVHSGAITGAGISQGKSTTMGFDTRFLKLQVWPTCLTIQCAALCAGSSGVGLVEVVLVLCVWAVVGDVECGVARPPARAPTLGRLRPGLFVLYVVVKGAWCGSLRCQVLALLLPASFLSASSFASPCVTNRGCVMLCLC